MSDVPTPSPLVPACRNPDCTAVPGTCAKRKHHCGCESTGCGRRFWACMSDACVWAPPVTRLVHGPARVTATPIVTARGRVLRKDGSVEHVEARDLKIDEETLARLQRRQDEANQGG